MVGVRKFDVFATLFQYGSISTSRFRAFPMADSMTLGGNNSSRVIAETVPCLVVGMWSLVVVSTRRLLNLGHEMSFGRIASPTRSIADDTTEIRIKYWNPPPFHKRTSRGCMPYQGSLPPIRTIFQRNAVGLTPNSCAVALLSDTHPTGNPVANNKP